MPSARLVPGPFGLVALMVISSDTGVMGGDAVRGGLRLAGWAVAGVITQGGGLT